MNTQEGLQQDDPEDGKDIVSRPIAAHSNLEALQEVQIQQHDEAAPPSAAISTGSLTRSTSHDKIEGTDPPEATDLVAGEEVIAPQNALPLPSSLESEHLTWKQKTGIVAIYVLVVGNVVILLTIGLLAFLWFADIRNPTWHSLIVRNWLSRTIAIISEALKQAVGFQIGVCSAMLAALALERFEVRLEKAASVSMMRGSVLGSGAIFSLLRDQRKSWHIRGKLKTSLPILITIFALVYSFTQAVTIILVSDVGLQQLPGWPRTSLTPFGLTWNWNFTLSNRPSTNTVQRSTTWLRKPQIYPTFAEYTEPPFVAKGVSDTGVTLRAFLPLAAATDRQDIHRYVGKSTVLDARVTCQVPNLQGEIIKSTTNNLYVNGSFTASRSTPRLGNFTQIMTPALNYLSNISIPFSCVAPTTEAIVADSKQWRITICQLGEGGGTSTYSGGLISEFRPLSWLPTPGSLFRIAKNSTEFGTAYLVLNVSLGSQQNWQAVTETGATPPSFSEHGEWRDLVYSGSSLVLSLTLCYSAFDTADIPVTIVSESNRTEPLPTYPLSDRRYRFDAVRKQLGQYRSRQTLAERGLLELQRQRSSWLAEGDETSPLDPVLRQFADMSGPDASGNHPNLTAIMWESSQCPSPSTFSYVVNPWICPDFMHVWLFQEIIQTGGSVAFGLQSLITVLASLAYYDQLAQFDKIENVEQTYFVTANTALRYRGFLAVAVVMAVHVILVTLVVLMFLRQTRYSMLGNTWQALAQVITDQMVDYVDMASGMSDEQVTKCMKERGEGAGRVGVDRVDDTGKIGLVTL